MMSACCARNMTSITLRLFSLKFIGLSSPSVKTRTTRRPDCGRSDVIEASTAFQSGVGPFSWRRVRRMRIWCASIWLRAASWIVWWKWSLAPW